MSKPVLLDFFNSELQLGLTKIEQCGTGAVYCQIIDKIYPGTFNIGSVKWQAKFDYEYMENYKILNKAFRTNGIQKNLDVDKLVKCRLLDNTEMCQWIKKYFELHYNGQEYDPVARRGGQDLFYIQGGNKVAVPAKTTAKPASQPSGTTAKPMTSIQKSKPAGGNSEALEKQVAELSSNNQLLDKEREFYFGKLRLIEEIITKNGLNKSVVGESVLKVLYAGEDEQMDIDGSGNIVIRTGGQEIIHQVNNDLIQASDADMQD